MQFQIDNAIAWAYTGGKPFDSSLPTLVFIHGAQNDHSVWALQSRYFAHHGYGVLAVDLPGHGRSNGPSLTSIEALATWIIRLLDAAGVARACLIGHSMGSLITLEAASRFPERLHKIALLGSAFPMKVSDSFLDAAKNDVQRAIEMGTSWSHSSIAQKPSCPGPGFYVPTGHLRLAQRIARINPEHGYFTDLSACNRYANGLQAAASLSCPALFICADRDVMTPAKAAQGLIKAVNGAKVVKIAACGHAMMAEQPDQVLRALRAFLA